MKYFILIGTGMTFYLAFNYQSLENFEKATYFMASACFSGICYLIYEKL